MNKEQQCRTYTKDVKLLRDIFLNNERFWRCPEIPLVLCLFVIIPLLHESDDSVVQSMDGVCSSNLLPPFQTSQRTQRTPTEEYCEMSMAHQSSVRTPPTFSGGNANRALPLHTEPTRTRTRWWKCAIDTTDSCH